MRNIAILAMVALAITVLPAGDSAATVAAATLRFAFVGAIGAAGWRLYRSRGFWLDALGDRLRGMLYGSAALIVLTLVAEARVRGNGQFGTLAWMALLAAGGGGIYYVWRESRRLAY